MYLYSDFEERGYRVEAYAPNSDADPVAFELRILVEGALRASLAVPMTYRPVFGIDSGDLAVLEMVADALMKALPPPEVFSEETPAQLFDIARRHGGGEWKTPTGRAPVYDMASSFSSTRADFLATILHFFRSAGEAEQWLDNPRRELNGLSPQQALQRGMGYEVMALINSLRPLANDE